MFTNSIKLLLFCYLHLIFLHLIYIYFPFLFITQKHVCLLWPLLSLSLSHTLFSPKTAWTLFNNTMTFVIINTPSLVEHRTPLPPISITALQSHKWMYRGQCVLLWPSRREKGLGGEASIKLLSHTPLLSLRFELPSRNISKFKSN